jgi:hypothetical protein
MSTPYWKLRRLAPRVIRVQGRRAAESPVIGAFGVTLVPKANAYITIYDAAVRYEATWKKESSEGKGAIGKLVSVIRSWLPLLVRDVPGFDPSTYADNPSVPDDVLADADRLEGFVEEYRTPAGEPLPYAETIDAALDVEGAAREWQEAEAADSQYQKLLANVRSAGADFDAELQLFRRSLLALFGKSDKDFQKLRVARASVTDEEDDSAAPPAPAPLEPAPPGITEPMAP